MTARRSRGNAPAVGAGALVLLALAAAACSSATPSATPPTTSTTPATTPPSTTTSSAGATTSGPTSTTAGVTTCPASQLQLTLTDANGAAGQQEDTVVMTNTGTITCTLVGYPGMQLYDASGAAIPTTVVRGQQTFAVAAANQPVNLVTLSPGQAGAYTLHYEDVPVGAETSCPISSTAQVTPPNDVDTVPVDLRIAPCNNGTVHVSPVYPSP